MSKLLFLFVVMLNTSCFAQKAKKPAVVPKASIHNNIKPGAYQMFEYLPRIKGKRVAIFANHTATVGNMHLVDTLQKLGVKITKIFGPEHGFRGTADAGEKVDNYIDKQTGLSVVSLYGKKRRPSKKDLEDVDVMIFDIQDVGVRFYTYISSLQDYIEASIDNNKPLIILDRPNPNGFYVDGPVLDTTYKSFIGMQPIPVVYGLTMGEYANLLLGQGWLSPETMVKLMTLKTADHLNNATENSNAGNITVIKCLNYTHKSRYDLPVKPSPNLPDAVSVYWYPSTCFFEGTVLSEGRGTDHPFVIFGHPSLPKNMYSFTPADKDGAKNPKLEGQLCFGWNLTDSPRSYTPDTKLQLQYLIKAYQLFPDKENFFIKPKKDNVKPTEIFFNKLAGNGNLYQQIINGTTEEEIRASWQPRLDAYKKIRKRYLMYPDFE